jgi:RNA polymerase sigma-70 factor (ECF subfamily)
MAKGDSGLLAAVKRGRPGAFEELAVPLADRLYSLLAGMVGKTDAEDLLQETFLKAYRGMRDFRGGSSFSTWITKIAINAARSHVRKKHPVSISDEIARESEDPSADRLDAMPSPAITPAEALEKKEQRKQVAVALEKLADEEREVLLLREIDELSYEEIAGVLEVSPDAVRSRLHRARQHMFGLLGGGRA